VYEITQPSALQKRLRQDIPVNIVASSRVKNQLRDRANGRRNFVFTAQALLAGMPTDGPTFLAPRHLGQETYERKHPGGASLERTILPKRSDKQDHPGEEGFRNSGVYW
jgi:hypothetical protein